MQGPLKIGCLFSCNENNPFHLMYLYNVLRKQREVSQSQTNTCYPILLVLLLLGTALQAGRSRVRFPVVSLEFFIDLILPATLCPWGRLSL